MPWDSIWNEGGGGAVPVGTLGGKITIIHRRKSKVASRVVNSHCPIPRRLTSSINWNENSVANGLIPWLQFRGGIGEARWRRPRCWREIRYLWIRKCLKSERSRWSYGAPPAAFRDGLRGPRGSLVQDSWKTAPDPRSGRRTPARRKLLGKYRPRRRNISSPSEAFFSKHFCAEIVDNVRHW